MILLKFHGNIKNLDRTEAKYARSWQAPYLAGNRAGWVSAGDPPAFLMFRFQVRLLYRYFLPDNKSLFLCNTVFQQADKDAPCVVFQVGKIPRDREEARGR